MTSLKPGVSCEFFDDGAVVLDSAQGKYYTLNSTAGRILERLDQGESETTILASLISEFPQEDPKEIENAIHDFLAEIRTGGLLEPGGK